MVRTLPLQSENRPELPRILAIAFAIAVHALALLLLLIPMATPVLAPIVDDRPDVFIFKREKQVIEKKEVEVVPKREVQAPTTKPQETTIPQVDPPVIVDGGTVFTNNTGTLDPGPVVVPGPVETGPVTVGSLAYVKAPPPTYPRAEIRSGIGGAGTLAELYFLVTGFHLLHVVFGTGILLLVAWRPSRANVVMIATLWHVIDLVWLVMFPIVYLT